MGSNSLCSRRLGVTHVAVGSSVEARGLNSNFFYLQREISAFFNTMNRRAGQESDGNEEDDSTLSDSDSFMYDSIKYLSGLPRTQNDLTYVGYCEFLARVVRRVSPDSLDGRGPYAVLATPLYVCQIETSEQLQW